MLDYAEIQRVLEVCQAHQDTARIREYAFALLRECKAKDELLHHATELTFGLGERAQRVYKQERMTGWKREDAHGAGRMHPTRATAIAEARSLVDPCVSPKEPR